MGKFVSIQFLFFMIFLLYLTKKVVLDLSHPGSDLVLAQLGVHPLLPQLALALGAAEDEYQSLPVGALDRVEAARVAPRVTHTLRFGDQRPLAATEQVGVVGERS